MLSLALLAIALYLILDPFGRERLPSARVTGPPQVVFDWSRDACSPEHIPDLPARAFRDRRGRVQLITAHFVNRRMVGPALGRLRVDCDPVLRSGEDPRPSAFDDREWIAAVHTEDGRTVHALLHEEFQGHRHAGACPQGAYEPCWYNAVTAAVSRDGGDSYAHAPAPSHLVAALPSRYRPGAGPTGLFSPSNIVRDPDDGRFYALLLAEARGAQRTGTCVMRTDDLADPDGWRAWDGERFSVRFADPYAEDVDPAEHVCAPVAFGAIGTMHESLTFNTHLGRWLLVGMATGTEAGERTSWGVWYSVSDDLVDWSPRRLLMRRERPGTFRCGDEDPVLYPSLIDPASPSRSFETTGRHAFLYLTRFNVEDCRLSFDRDLVRVPVELSR
jgi:hypothetical protein